MQLLYSFCTIYKQFNKLFCIYNLIIDFVERSIYRARYKYKLASLYICRMFNKNANTSLLDTSESVSHDNDILQSYYNYIEAKRQYQQYEVAEPNLLYNMQILCDDLIELISTLYHNTEIEGERALIVKMINDLRGAI